MKRSEDPNETLIRLLTELSLMLASRLATRGGAADISAAMDALLHDIALAPTTPLYRADLEKMALELAAMARGDAEAIAARRYAPTMGQKRR
jgi:hypothetical protein